MPRVRWGINASDVDDFDRDSQYTPYAGPIPPNGVYVWQVKVLKHVAGTRDKFPQLRIGLELSPRSGRKGESQFKGYFVMNYCPISDRTAWRYVSFLDAIGVSGRDFTDRTVTDEDGNIKRIGKWRNTGKVLIAAELKDDTDEKGNSRKAVGWMGAVPDDFAEDDDGEFDDSDVDYVDDVDTEDGDEDDDYEEDPPPHRSSRKGTTATKRKTRTATKGRRRPEPDDDEDDPF